MILFNGRCQLFGTTGVSVLLLLTLAASSAVAQDTPTNLDFETPYPIGTHIAPPWFIGQNQPNYEVGLDSNGAYHGKYWVHIRSLSSPGDKEFANLTQTFDATRYRGRFICYRAAVRHTGKVRGDARLWMRVDRPESRRGFFSSKADRPIKSTEWEQYQIVGYVAPDAKNIFIGCSLQGVGAIGFDDVSLDTVSKTNKEILWQFQMPETLTFETIDGQTENVSTADIMEIVPSSNETIVTLINGNQIHAVGNYDELARYFEMNK